MQHIFPSEEVLKELRDSNAVVAIFDSDIPCYSVACMAEKEKAASSVERTVDNFMFRVKRDTKATHYISLLTDGKTNFRNEVAVTAPYKGNRVSLERPKWYGHIKDYTVDRWSGQIMFGIEADDALTLCAKYLESHGIKAIICTLDKDLRQFPGWHYNWDSRKLTYVDYDKGEYNLWKQVLMGDMGTDNIPGLSDAAWLPTEPFRTPIFESYLKVPNEGAHTRPYFAPKDYVMEGGEKAPKVVQPKLLTGKEALSAVGVKNIYGAKYLDYFDNISLGDGCCSGAFTPVVFVQPAGIQMAHAKLTGWEEVTDLTYVKALQEFYYGPQAVEELLEGVAVEDYPKVVLEEFVSAYWEEAVLQEYDDPAELGQRRFLEVFRLVYMLRDIEEIPNDAVINFTPLTFQAKVYDDFGEDDDVDTNDSAFDF